VLSIDGVVVLLYGGRLTLSIMDVLGVGCARVSFFETWPKKRYRKKMEYDLKASDLFDCFAEDDDLELKAMFGAPRLQSGMSDSSTESSLAPSPSLLSSNLTLFHV
jgi:hypothetical protein